MCGFIHYFLQGLVYGFLHGFVYMASFGIHACLPIGMIIVWRNFRWYQRSSFLTSWLAGAGSWNVEIWSFRGHDISGDIYSLYCGSCSDWEIGHQCLNLCWINESTWYMIIYIDLLFTHCWGKIWDSALLCHQPKCSIILLNLPSNKLKAVL